MKARKLLIIGGMFWFFLGLLHGFIMSPRIATLTNQEKSAHSHVLCLSTAVIIVGLLQSYITLPEKWRNICSWLLIAGSILLPVGVLLEMVFLAVIGSISFIAGFLLSLVGAIRYKT